MEARTNVTKGVTPVPLTCARWTRAVAVENRASGFKARPKAMSATVLLGSAAVGAVLIQFVYDASKILCERKSLYFLLRR